MSTGLIVCRNTESAILHAKVSDAWLLVKRLNFAEMTPSTVTKCTLLLPVAVGAGAPSHEGAGGHSGAKTVKLEDTEYRGVSISEAALSPFTCAFAVGSLRHVVYKDGAEFVFRVVEISDVQRLVSYELIETDSTVNVSSVLHTIQLMEVTESDDCVLSWTTEFSGDCDQHVYSDAKFKKLDALKDIRTVLGHSRR